MYLIAGAKYSLKSIVIHYNCIVTLTAKDYNIF